MELYLSDGIYLINPREIRCVRYYSQLGDLCYSPDEKFENTSEDDKKYIKKIIEIEMYGFKIGNYGNKIDNIIKIDVSNDKENESYKEIRQRLSRKFGMNLQNNNRNEEYIITLFEKGIEIEKIAEILKMRKNNINKIIEEYKSKKNGT
ncbi:MAG: hypothetical protein LBS37_02575 [Treponema sp.]|jgi:hypothetical protein|nr:hypothetical protein [Treponema sp.]